MSSEFWWGFGAGGAFVSVVTLTTAVVRGLWHRRRAYRWGRGISPKAAPVLMEVRDNRRDRNLMRAWDADGRELTEMERILLDKPPGMGTGTCANPAHASQHPPHVETDEVLGEYWCVGGWVRTDGTIPGGI